VVSWSQGGDSVDITLLTFRETGQGWETQSHETTYRALRRETLTAALARAGFQDVRWRMPEESGYFQPVVTARAV
jgi:glycine/sarcosine N-methyltransferase